MADNGVAATLAKLTELVKLQQEQIALLQQNQKTETRTIPSIPKLTKAEDLNTWREKLTRILSRYDLNKYINRNVPKPREEDPTKHREWLRDCIDVDDYIQASVPNLAVWNAIRGLGWSAKENNPKKTFDFLVQYFERGTVDTFVKLNYELVTIRCKDFHDGFFSDPDQFP